MPYNDKIGEWEYIGEHHVTAGNSYGNPISFVYSDYTEILVVLYCSNYPGCLASSVYSASDIVVNNEYEAMTIHTFGDVGLVNARVKFTSNTATLGCSFRHSGYTGYCKLYAR